MDAERGLEAFRRGRREVVIGIRLFLGERRGRRGGMVDGRVVFFAGIIMREEKGVVGLQSFI